MKTPDYFCLVISPEKMHVTGRNCLRNAVTIGFVALVALRFTAPVNEAPSAFAAPLPMPAALWGDDYQAALKLRHPCAKAALSKDDVVLGQHGYCSPGVGRAACKPYVLDCAASAVLRIVSSVAFGVIKLPS